MSSGNRFYQLPASAPQSSAAAALQGASLAFSHNKQLAGRPQVQVQVQPHVSTNSSPSRSRDASARRPLPHNTDSPSPSPSPRRGRPPSTHEPRTGSATLAAPPPPHPLRQPAASPQRSPSFIAATLAASRSASPIHRESHSHSQSPPVAAQPSAAQPSVALIAAEAAAAPMAAARANLSSTSLLFSPPTTIAAPDTSRLISLFETAPARRPTTPVKPAGLPKPKAFTPPRERSPEKKDVKAAPPVRRKPVVTTETDMQAKPKVVQPQPPNPEIKVRPPEPRKTAKARAPARDESRESGRAVRVPTPRQNAASVSSPARPATNTALTDMTSAILAGSLAAARHPTTTTEPGRGRPPPPLPPPPRGSHDILSAALTGGSSTSPSRHGSPVRRTATMPMTLRPMQSLSDGDEAEDRRSRRPSTTHRHRLHRTPSLAMVPGSGKHKHKHHEGARRRWREAMTERQRRRYEAVWASNRGGLGIVGGLPGDEEDDTVPNVVVRDLWRRSRLPADELAEVWALVDRRGTGRLGKESFVVGLWLIDQRLRGRKIPARVSESVWSSARGMKAVGRKLKA